LTTAGNTIVKSTIFQVQNATGNFVLTGNTTNGQVLLGQASNLNDVLVFNSSGSANTVTIQPASTLSASYTLQLPSLAAGTYNICTDSGNCSGVGATLQTSYNNSVGGTTPEIKLNSTVGGINIQDADSTIGGNLLSIRASNGGGLGQSLLSVGNTGQVLAQNSANTASAFQIDNAAGTSLFNVNTNYDSANLISNGGFEQNTIGWSAKGAASPPARDTTQHYEGSADLAITTSTAANDGAKFNVPLASSTQYELTIVGKLASGTFVGLELGRSEDGTNNLTCATSQTLITTAWT